MEWDEIQRVAVIFAHPDDAEYGSAGTSAKLARAGKEVTYVVVTDGSKGSSDPEMTRARLAEIRREEQCRAAEILGVQHVEFLNFEDGVLQPTLDLRKAVTAAIRRYKPDVVICPTPDRNLSMGVFVQHPDHLAVGEASLAAVYPSARDRMTFPELLAEGLEPHNVREVWVTGTGDSDHFIDITETIDTKIKALKAHASQVTSDVETWMPERARQIGEPHGMQYAEGFRRIEIG
ncbi:MAG TPA: PIG-L deacetylase family protein [Chloroflexota bacterium]|nr:PIG-L deacetylase family protein [Chloroflexota bacterium]